MSVQHYPLIENDLATIFHFHSVGPKGSIEKIIRFDVTEVPGLYNLGFGDYDRDNQSVDDQIVSDNGDQDQVLSTVAEALYRFTGKYPWAWVYATGSTPSRTRLYRMGINRFMSIANEDFTLFGEINDQWESFVPNRNYKAFLAKRNPK